MRREKGALSSQSSWAIGKGKPLKTPQHAVKQLKGQNKQQTDLTDIPLLFCIVFCIVGFTNKY